MRQNLEAKEIIHEDSNSGWREVEIEELIEEGILFKPIDGNHGNIHPTSNDYVERGIPFLLASDVENNKVDLINCKFISKETAQKLQKGFAQEGDILLTHKGSVGNTAIVPKINTEYIVLTPQVTYYRIKDKEKLDNRYLMSFFQSEYFQKQLKVIGKGATRAYIGIVAQQKLKILLPYDLKEQKKIASILFTWDKAIELKEKLIVQKKEQKKGLMQKLLFGHIRFGDGQKFTREENKKRIKLISEGKVPPGYKKAKRFIIPVDWDIKKIEEIAEQVTITNNKSVDYTVLSCTKYDGLVNSLDYFGKQVFSDDTSKYKVVARNHFAYATNHIEEGSIGLQKDYDFGLVSPMYTVFKTQSRINNEFLFALLKTETYRRIYETMMSASVDRRGSLRWKDFSKIYVPIPSVQEQQKISEIITTANIEIEKLEKELVELKEQKKSLMQLLLTGKVRVKG